ncbi:histone H3 (Lys4) methyltransferase complex, subunit SET1 [Handroanthus impetiginosus]|uniref:Histone H3 (Lys4) methyltransferase complex, subunit SET1 n=1 Tax=Handroanthus impetiginosus TaxID=429701 RepID=A0A2G9HC93_9LAMI|nr:histone H3 (Lys4) methyltransferase complex, subunit SET1 [Handroanthus impetiginosus]
MGDGGIACVPSQHVIDKFPVCGGKANGKTKLNSSTKSSLKLAKVSPKMKQRKDKGSELGTKSVGSLNKEVADKNCNGDVCNGDNEEEVEEGELGTLPIENEEFVQEKPTRRYEIKSEIERGEFIPGRWQKSGGEFGRKEWRSSKEELEKGEFVSDRWCRSEIGRTDEYGYSKTRRYNNSKGKGWTNDRKYSSERFDREAEWTPHSGKEKGWKADREWSPPSAGKYFGEKEVSRGSSQHLRKFSSRYETDKNVKISSKVAGDEGSLKHDVSNGKNHVRDYSFSSRLKRHGNDPDSYDRKYRGEYDEYSSSKSRKLSEDGSHSTFSSDYYSGRYKNAATSSSRNIPPEKFSSRNLGSPRDRARNHDHRDRSPARRDRSPYERLYDRSRSPYDRSRHYDNRYRSPSYVERSPRDQSRNHDGRDMTPTLLERSPRDRGRYSDHKETNRKSVVGDKWQSPYGSKGQEAKNTPKDSGGTESQTLAKESQDRGSLDNGNGFSDKAASPTFKGKEPSQENGVTEDPASMEEDMDICNTPPHVPVVADSAAGKWYYLDHVGVERGPAKLSDLRTLVEEGYLVSDHLIKHSESDRWVTVENAVSPLVTVNFPSVVPETVTQLVCPPEAPGNLAGEEMLTSSSHPIFCSEDNSAASKYVEHFHIDDRVGALLEGVTLIPGREVEIVTEALQTKFDLQEWERWGKEEGFTWHQQHTGEHCNDSGAEVLPIVSESTSKDTEESRTTLLASSEMDDAVGCSGTDAWFSGQWACKGGDWKRNDETAQDRTWKRKLVLNDGYPICQMPKSGCEDPRWQQKDELYYPSQSRKLELPPWAFTLPDELNDPGNMTRSSVIKPALVKGLKGTMLPVIRINACVVKDQGSLVSEPRVKVRGKERYSSRSLRLHSTTSDTKRSSEDSHSKRSSEQDSWDSRKKSAPFSIPKDHLCKVDELQLHMGDWYYLDGAGHERGPLSFSELQVMADQGVIHKQSSVFRRRDKVWVPVNHLSEATGMTEQENDVTSVASLSEARVAVLSGSQRVSSAFHDLHPQFIGYTRGKLHELVMKSYKGREFGAAINEVLDPWINARQPKKEMEKHIYNSEYLHASKRARIDGIEEEYEMEDVALTSLKDECEFDDLRADVTFSKTDEVNSTFERGSWDLLDGHVLARVFHFLRSDMKSLVYAALTCKHWRSVVKFYKDISKQVNFCAIAPTCSDSMIVKIMNDYKKEKITSMLLRGCTGITSGMLEELLQSFPCLSSIDIRGCPQLEDLVYKFPNITWVKSRVPQLKIRSLNHLADKSSAASSQMDDSTGLKEYLESSEKRDSANQLFRRSLYKRSKLFDARKSSSILSRDAQLRRLAMKKSGNGYKRLEEFIAISLRDIMKENSFEFFDHKVAEIEERMKSGYYARRGLNSVKEDIRRMCLDAIRIKNRGDSRDMNRIVSLFIRLATSLESGSKLAFERDEGMKSLKGDSPPGFSTASSKYKKNLGKLSERKDSYRSNGTLYINGFSDSGDYASDREIRRRLSKLNRKALDSGSETSDDFDKSSDGSMSDSESTASDTESDLELQSEGAIRDSIGESYFTSDDGFDSLADEREWGARMTKASLVPPVTRKYEVIDHYVIVADEEEVKRKMQVCLPEDYAEKLNAQRNGTEESDMEIPEVKDYKPRKSLGDEVLEQEVYGIDPYTHNLLLDSMPDESDWSLIDKHLFIEDVLLCTLNKQVRHFTGSGNTPMMYPLKSVFEEILETAEENSDWRTMRVCQFILKAIDSRPEDNYVAYRKGLGVVCNKKGGFSKDDFVVEFLGEVYPTWKWFEKQDGIRSLQKNSEDPAPEFYNIYLERPKGDGDGYDLVVVDAMHKANYASRICHSCKPNCEAKVTAVDGQYQIGIYSVRPIAYGEEITFDYNSVTESKEEYEASVCLCGNQVCRGSYLNLTGEGAFQKVLKEYHGILDRHRLMLEACELNFVSEEDYIDLGKAGLGSCLLGGLPDWLIAYSARLVRFINFERTRLPSEILRHIIAEKKKYFADICLEVEKSDAEIQAEGVYNQRLQNLALTIDKVKYVMRCVFGDPKRAPPPLEKLSPEAAVSYLWKGQGSFVEELIQCMTPHIEEATLRELRAKIRGHDPTGSDNIEMELRKSLLWLRDELRNLPCTYKSRHDAAADLIHIYAHTKYFFRIREYKTVTSPPVYITPLDLGPKYADKLGSGVHEYRKTYGEIYCLAQLMFWHTQNAEPDASLAKASRGCLSLPDVGSFYAKVQKPSRQLVYGPRTMKFMLARMEKQPQRHWPNDRIWSFKSSPKIVGSPMLDAVLHKAPVDKEMIHWLKNRPPIYQAMWDG